MLKCACELCNGFQSTLPRRERPPIPFLSPSCSSDFNPRSREGSDSLSPCLSHNVSNFNPRSREGSDNIHCHLFVSSALFQSTLPRRERHNLVMISRGAVEFQSTLPRRERRYTIYLYQISTLYFNPRSREGSDRPILYRRFKLLQISIHAPAKGATLQ